MVARRLGGMMWDESRAPGLLPGHDEKRTVTDTIAVVIVDSSDQLTREFRRHFPYPEYVPDGRGRVSPPFPGQRARLELNGHRRSPRL